MINQNQRCYSFEKIFDEINLYNLCKDNDIYDIEIYNNEYNNVCLFLFLILIFILIICYFHL